MSAFVLDNSVTMRWCLEENSRYAEDVLDEIIAGVQAYVPALWFYEVISVMAESERNGSLTTLKARGFFEDLRFLEIQVDPVPERQPVSVAAHWLAIELGWTGYDAAYLELAIRKRLPLASLDKDLNRADRRAGVELVKP